MKKICGDCLHYNACAAWNIGSLANTEAGGCVNFEHCHLYDAVEVVRCKDCQWLGIKDFVYGYCRRNGLDGIVKPDDYCSRGQRKEGEE